MGLKSVLTGMFIISSAYLLFVYQFEAVSAAPGSPNNMETHHRPSKTRHFTRFGRLASGVQYSRIKTEPISDFLVDDDDLFELSKRQNSDDYGHLRFGKRAEEAFDDYGHMRFGRSDKK